MPRYFFHVRHDEMLVPDDEGGMFEDFEMAMAEAERSARDIAVNAIRQKGHIQGWSIELSNEAGDILKKISARDVTN